MVASRPRGRGGGGAKSDSMRNESAQTSRKDALTAENMHELPENMQDVLNNFRISWLTGPDLPHQGFSNDVHRMQGLSLAWQAWLLALAVLAPSRLNLVLKGR